MILYDKWGGVVQEFVIFADKVGWVSAINDFKQCHNW